MLKMYVRKKPVYPFDDLLLKNLEDRKKIWYKEGC